MQRRRQEVQPHGRPVFIFGVVVFAEVRLAVAGHDVHGENQYGKFINMRELDRRLHFGLGHFSLSVIFQNVGVAHVYLRQVKIAIRVFLFF